MKKEFERPELIIINFENELVTAVSGEGDIDPGNDIGDVNVGGNG